MLSTRELVVMVLGMMRMVGWSVSHHVGCGVGVSSARVLAVMVLGMRMITKMMNWSTDVEGEEECCQPGC